MRPGASRRWGLTDNAGSTSPAAGSTKLPAGSRRDGCVRRAVACALLALTACGFVSRPALAQPRAGVNYFVDFRSRPGYLFGHTFIVYGRIDARGKPFDTHVAGIYPVDGQAGLIVGSMVPVRASVRGVRDDFSERPTNIYRKHLSAAQYARLVRSVRGLRVSEREWDLLFKNCNDFAIAVAKEMDMVAPPSWLLPYFFVGQLRLMNGP
jgi:hypothetical protein